MTDTLHKILSSTPLKILIGVVIGLSMRYFVDLSYSLMRRGGLTPEMPYVHVDTEGDPLRTEVMLVPFEGFKSDDATALAQALSADLGIRVAAAGEMPIPGNAMNGERKQYVADRFYDPLHEYAQTLEPSATHRQYIGIVAGDMYCERTTWNYCLALGFENNVSVIATDRLVPYGFIDRQMAGRLYGNRLLKMAKRSIGLYYYQHPRSSNPKSLLFSPLMSVGQLDEMSFDYRVERTADSAVTSPPMP